METAVPTNDGLNVTLNPNEEPRGIEKPESPRLENGTLEKLLLSQDSSVTIIFDDPELWIWNVKDCEVPSRFPVTAMVSPELRFLDWVTKRIVRTTSKKN